MSSSTNSNINRHSETRSRSRNRVSHRSSSSSHHRDDRTTTSPPQQYRARSRTPNRGGGIVTSSSKESEEERAKMRDAHCVFVTQLQVKATEEDVDFYFGTMCRVREVALVKEKMTGRSKGFGYVELCTLEDVKSALLLSGLPFAWRDGTLGFPITVRPSEAYKQYMEHGAVIISSNKQHQQMLKRDQPQSQQQQQHQVRVEIVEQVGPGSALASVDGGPPQLLPTHRGRAVYTKMLFVGNVDKSLGERELREVFQAFGAVDTVQIKTDSETGESKGFAFCRFEQVAFAAHANDKLNGFELMGLKLTCNPVADKQLLAQRQSNNNQEEEIARPARGQQQQHQQPSRRMELMSKLGGGAAQEWAVPPPPPPSSLNAVQEMITPRIALANMFDAAQETQPQWEMEIERDTKEECERFGRVISCVVDARTNLVYVTFTSAADAKRCADALQGRWFDKRQIRVDFLPPL